MGKKPIIQIIDSIHSKANPEARKLILPLLKYKKLSYRKTFIPGKRHRTINQNVEVISHMITGREGTSGQFYTGFIDRIKNSHGNKIKILKEEFEVITKEKSKPKLNGIEFRNDQLKAIDQMNEKQRGLVILPTGSGKTLVALGFLSMYPSCRILFLCHTIDLINQTSEELKRFGINHLLFGGGNKIDFDKILKKDKCIIVSTIQSISKISKDKIRSFFDITIVDEVHHCANENNQYCKFMNNNLSPIRIGLTATIPTSEEEKLTLEGIFGPVIYELTEKEGKEIGIIAKAKVNFLPVLHENSIQQKININKTYPSIYDNAIVNNKTRNMLIIREVKKNIENNETTLIIVEKIEHGNNIKKLLDNENITCPFVQGKSEDKYRDKNKSKLKKEKIKVCICTKVWKEGVNIPSLKNIILASGMKDEKSILQAMGRGLRIAEGKTKIKLVDFMDPYAKIAEHSVIRYSIYKKLGWVK